MRELFETRSLDFLNSNQHVKVTEEINWEVHIFSSLDF